jgi:hypothetical protein
VPGVCTISVAMRTFCVVRLFCAFEYLCCVLGFMGNCRQTKPCYLKLLRFLFDILVLRYLCIQRSVIQSNWGEDCVKTAVKSPPGGRRVAGGEGTRDAVTPGGREYFE